MDGTNQLLAEVRQKVGMGESGNDDELDLSADSAQQDAENGRSRQLLDQAEESKDADQIDQKRISPNKKLS